MGMASAVAGTWWVSPPGKDHQDLPSQGFGIQIMEAVVVLHPLSPQVCSAPVPGSKPLRSAGEGKHSTQGKAF